MHIVSFVIFHRIRLLTLAYWIVVCDHTCVHRLKLRKLRIVDFTSWSFRQGPVWWLRFWGLFYTLWLHFGFCYNAHFVSRFWTTTFLLKLVQLIVLLYIILKLLVPIRWLLHYEFATYDFLIWWWVFICKYWFHFTIDLLRDRCWLFVIIWYYLVNFMDTVILLIIILLCLITIFKFTLFFYDIMAHFFHDLFHHFLVFGHFPFLLSVFIFIYSLQQVPLLLLRLVYYF